MHTVVPAKMQRRRLYVWQTLTHVKNHVVDVGGLFREAVDNVEGDGHRPAVGTGRVVRELDGLVEPGDHSAQSRKTIRGRDGGKKLKPQLAGVGENIEMGNM